MSTNVTRTERQYAVTAARTWLFAAFLLVPVAAACGSDNTSSSGYTGEFGTDIESNAQVADESLGNEPVEMLRELIEIVILGLLSLCWTILRTLVCFVATGWIGILVLIAAFLSAAIYYLRYRDPRDDWHKAIAVGAIASLPVLVIRILC